MVTSRNFAVTINVDGMPLEEFGTQEDIKQPHRNKKSPVIKRYIEAVSGKEFSIEVSGKEAVEALSDCASFTGRLYIDGQRQARKVCDRAHDFIMSLRTHRYAEDGETKKQTFVFGKLDIQENGNEVLLGRDDVKDIGLIEFAILRNSSSIRSSQLLKYGENAAKSPDELTVQEKDLKGMSTSHALTYGDSRPHRPRNAWHTSSIDSDKKPYITFQFFYRSRASLQALGLIPRDPSPEPVIPLEERDPDDLTLEEARQQVKKLREANVKYQETQEKYDKLRQTLSGALGPDSVMGIKRERSDDNDDNDEDAPIMQEIRPVKRRMEFGETMILDD